MFLSNTRAVQAAEKYMRRGKLLNAVAKRERTVERNPGDLTAANALGDLYVQAGRIEEAVSIFSSLADRHCGEGFVPRAIAMLKKIVRLDASAVDALAKLAELHERLGRKAEAIEWHRKLANAYESAAQAERALTVYKRIAEIEPHDESIQAKLGDSLEVTGLDQVDLSEDEFVIKQIFRAEVLATRGSIDEAATILREILSYAPDNVPARSKLKDVYLRAGMAELAANECLQLARIRESRKMEAIGYLEDQLEFGLLMEPPSSKELSLFEQRRDHAFEFFANPGNRRNAARVALSLPVLVSSDDDGWREFAESVNVSQSGVLLRLAHSVKPSSTLRASLPMPVKLRANKSTRGLYVVDGTVRHVSPDLAGDHIVGIEFQVGAEPETECRQMMLHYN